MVRHQRGDIELALARLRPIARHLLVGALLACDVHRLPRDTRDGCDEAMHVERSGDPAPLELAYRAIQRPPLVLREHAPLGELLMCDFFRSCTPREAWKVHLDRRALSHLGVNFSMTSRLFDEAIDLT